MNDLFVPSIQEELETEKRLLMQAKAQLRQAETPEETIAARMLLGRHTQRIRRLERDLREGY